jgi:hypothetical protein
MAASVLGRKVNYKTRFKPDKIAAIKAGIDADPKFKALATANFCFLLPHHMKSNETPCGCVHCSQPILDHHHIVIDTRSASDHMMIDD